MRPLRRQPTRLPRPWDFPGKNTGVGCHFLLQGWQHNYLQNRSHDIQNLVFSCVIIFQDQPSCSFDQNPMWFKIPWGRELRQEQRVESITWPIVWFPNRPNATQTGVLLTLPSCFCRSELTETHEELDISFPTNLRPLLCFLLFSLSERAILLPNNISAPHPDNSE